MKIVKFKKTKILDKDAKCVFKSEIDFDSEKKKIINFCLILVFHEGEEIHEIIKYDGSHGYCHVHKYYEKMGAKGEKCYPSQIDSKSIIVYKKDIFEKWEKYIEKYR
jgi:hypothetical protein